MQLKHIGRQHDRNRFSCKACIETCNMLTCSVCKKQQPPGNFSETPVCHRARSEKRGTLTCDSCFTPPCTNSACRGCRTCYSTQCKQKTCTKPSTLWPEDLPRTEEELKTWKCPTCIFICCQVCSKEPNTARARSRRLTKKQRWTCADCEQKQLQHKDRQYQ